MQNTKNLKRFGTIIFSIGFGLMLFGDPFHIIGGLLILISVWIDNFVQEQIDAYFESQMTPIPVDAHYHEHEEDSNLKKQSTRAKA